MAETRYFLHAAHDSFAPNDLVAGPRGAPVA